MNQYICRNNDSSSARIILHWLYASRVSIREKNTDYTSVIFCICCANVIHDFRQPDGTHIGSQCIICNSVSRRISSLRFKCRTSPHDSLTNKSKNEIHNRHTLCYRGDRYEPSKTMGIITSEELYYRELH